MRHLVLIGMMGSGKSTVGKVLQRRTHCPLYDTDKLIEVRAGMPVSEIFAYHGEAVFRQMEAELIEELTLGPAGIFSTGGGSFLNPETRQRLLETGIVFYLKASPEMLSQRVRGGNGRPLLQQNGNVTQTIRDILRQRESIYEEAHHIIVTDQRGPESVAEQILQHLPRPFCGGL